MSDELLANSIINMMEKSCSAIVCNCNFNSLQLLQLLGNCLQLFGNCLPVLGNCLELFRKCLEVVCNCLEIVLNSPKLVYGWQTIAPRYPHVQVRERSPAPLLIMVVQVQPGQPTVLHASAERPTSGRRQKGSRLKAGSTLCTWPRSEQLSSRATHASTNP